MFLCYATDASGKHLSTRDISQCPYPPHAHLGGSGVLGPIVEVPSAPHTDRGRGEGCEEGKGEWRENGGKAKPGNKRNAGLLRNSRAAETPASSTSFTTSASTLPYLMSYTACRRFAFDYSIAPQLITDQELLRAVLLCQGLVTVTVTEGEGEGEGRREREEEGDIIGDIDMDMASVIGECHPSPPENFLSPFISPYPTDPSYSSYLSYPPPLPYSPHSSAHRYHAPHTAQDISGRNVAHTVKGMKGLSFCEFLELVATVALEGLCEQERGLFKNPFAKVREFCDTVGGCY